MSLRFTETNKWKDDWYLSLSNDNRIIWQYLIDNCSIAGIWQKGFTHLNYFCKTNIQEPEFRQIFEHRCYDMGKFYFIPKFIKVQYPSGINSNKPLIISVKRELEKFNLLTIINESLGNDYLIIKVKEKGKGKGKRKKEVVKEIIEKHELQNFISENLSNVSKLETQLTFEQCEKILSEFDRQIIIEVLGAMENKKDLTKKYTSVNLTLRNWIKNHKPNGNSKTTNGNGTPEVKVGRSTLSELERFANAGKKPD